MSEDLTRRLGTGLSFSVLAEHVENGQRVIDQVQIGGIVVTAPWDGIERGVQMHVVETGDLPREGETCIDVRVPRGTGLQPHG